MKTLKILRVFTIIGVVAISLAMANTALADPPGPGGGKPDGRGFDENGTNDQANIFVGTGMDWCMGKFGNEAFCVGYMGPYANDRLVMKWNEEWDRGNAEGWTDPDGYAAWINNQWNGNMPDGSGETWHYKIEYDQTCADGGTPDDGGYCIWGDFEVIQSQGTVPSDDGNTEHVWDAQAIPNGYGDAGETTTEP